MNKLLALSHISNFKMIDKHNKDRNVNISKQDMSLTQKLRIRFENNL